MGKTYTAKEIRSLFKDFFSKKGHHIVPSAKVVVKGDPTLLFCNAGMNQFKDVILGNVPVESSRVADSQKCIRVTGKHNDLEEVGRDTYHHTFFEMLGNWSFGDYFKKEAIEWAWEFLTEVLHLEKERLYATIFEGSPSEGLEKDTEAQTMWEAFLPKSHIVEGNKHDNFWEMGDVGPCGPCSEIHIDLRSDAERREKEGVELVNQGHPLVIEIWNLVFMQYNRRSDGSLAPLPKKVIDTGMGFERLCMAVQGKRSNYDTDVFTPILSSIEKVSGKKYGENEEVDIAMRVVADHIRSISFAIADGCLPSNQKAGYVIRRILRRAVRYAYTFLGQGEAFLYRLLPSLIESMGEEYTELREQRNLIENVIKEEEEAFLKTLASGIKLLERLIEECRKRGEKEISGKDTFMLYDTFGFPLDLTQLILQENNLGTNLDEFNQEMRLQKERARNSSNIDLGDWIVLGEGNTSFVGYDTMECKTKILRYRELKQKNQTLYQVVLSQTPFYAEKGGEVGDTGVLIDEEGKEYPITDTKNENNLSLHFLSSLPKNMEGEFVAKINLEDRESTACNHSATHLLHEALREVLGTHVEQKGSFVNAKTLRFDFSHFAKLTNEEIRLVERKVNAKIRRNIPLDEKRSIPIEEAKAMGAMALFSEKYGNQVRVIKFGSSVELCGGCHVKATGNIGMFKIVSESSSSAGIRRIEAITGKNLEELMYITQDTMGNLRSFLNNTPDVLQAVKKEIELNAELKHQVEGFFKMQVENLKGFILQNGRRDCGNTLVYELHGEHSTDMVKEISSQIRGELKGNFAFVATTLQKGKPSILVLLSEEAVRGGLNASTLVREGSKHIQGGGGGQPFLATAGGKNPEGLPMAFDAILNLIKTQG